MADDVRYPIRKSPRIPGYDYALAGAYLVTVTVDDRTNRFGHIEDSRTCLNEAGTLVEAVWNRVPERFGSVELDAFVVMPNHFHGILFLGVDPDAEPPSLIAIMQAFKSETTIEYGRGVKVGKFPRYHRALWHRSFHDRIIRDERILALARDYVADNPRKWQEAHGHETSCELN